MKETERSEKEMFIILVDIFFILCETENRTSGRNNQRLNICPTGVAESSEAE